MSRILLILFMICSLFAKAKDGHNVIFVTKDSLTVALDNGWKFRAADSQSFARPDYNDAGWIITRSPYMMLDSMDNIVWLRLRLHIDSSLANRPLAIGLTQYGASELYLDGKKLESFGTIGTRSNSFYYDPQYNPFIIQMHDTGIHVFAVRFANFEAKDNVRKFQKRFVGFRLNLGETITLIDNDSQSRVGQSTLYALFTGIFLALGLLHLLLFLYYRTYLSNFSFSVFSFCIAGLFIISFINRFTVFPEWQLRASFSSYFIGIGACLALSAFINQVFEKKNKTSFWIIHIMALAAVVTRFIHYEAGLLIVAALIISVSFETVIVTIIAIVRKAKGARIVGMGLIFFTGLLLLIAGITIASGGNFEINENSGAGTIWLLAIFTAILSLPVSMSAYLAYRFSSVNKDLKNQLTEVQRLSDKTLEQEQEKQRILENQKDELEREVVVRTQEVRNQKEKIEQQHEQLKEEKRKSDDLLLNILPSEVAEELKTVGNSEARQFDEVTVLFTDFVNFTKAGEQMSAKELVHELHSCFKAFDEIISKYEIEKIKTIGDAYLAVCGLPNHTERHAEKAVSAAAEILQFMRDRKRELQEKTFDIRIGVHSGPVVAGIVGVKKFAYDIWGDTVNTAARMEQSSEKGKINISETTYELIKGKFDCTYRGEIAAKNKGDLKMYFVNVPAAQPIGREHS